MNVSSVSSSIASLSTAALTKNEQLNEGTRPDGDGDKDDAVQVATTTQNNLVGASGSIINTLA